MNFSTICRPQAWVRSFLAMFFSAALTALAADPGKVRVLVWDEQQPQQRLAYSNFLGNEIADYLRQQPGLEVRSARLADADQGLSAQALDQTDVLIWWGHVRHKEVSTETGRALVQRIKSGRLSLIALHSAHWSTPFVEAMNERARIDALAALPGDPDEHRTGKARHDPPLATCRKARAAQATQARVFEHLDHRFGRALATRKLLRQGIAALGTVSG